MNDFVEQCLGEWKRLGVADALAADMAADLAADLEEAAAEGLSADAFLGSSAHDPASFAAAWASARGIVPAPAPPPRRRPLVLIGFTTIAAVTLVVAAALLATGEPKVSIVTAGVRSGPVPLLPSAPGFSHGASGRVLSTSAASPVEWILLVLAIVAVGFAAWLWSARRRSRLSSASAS